MCGIGGPTENFWLDYLEATGVWNQMRVAAPRGNANVALEWELIDVGSESPCMWRVAVRALRSIRPFESFVHHEAHQKTACLRRGFTKSVDSAWDMLLSDETTEPWCGGAGLRLKQRQSRATCCVQSVGEDPAIYSNN